MLRAAKETVAYIDGCEQIDLSDDCQLTLALVRAIAIVGEATSQVSDERRQEYLEFPWDKMRGSCNRLIYAGFVINLTILWATVTSSLPRLIDQFKMTLKQR